MPLHMVLVGLPGCGKTVAGGLAASRLGSPFVDLDEMIVREQGQSIDRLFAAGESVFRGLERDAMQRTLNGPPGVIAPGGGWAAQPGNLEAATGQAVLVYLRVTPGTAAERIGDPCSRPLLAGTDPVRRLTELLEQREASYRRAGHSIDTDGRTPEMVADSVVNLARKHGGWP
jgi:shikimate kinase